MAEFNFSQGLRVDTNADTLNDAPAGSVSVNASTGLVIAFLDSKRSAFPTSGLALSATLITATDGDDLIQAGVDDTTIAGLGGDDEINGFTGNDTLRGGAGKDQINDDGGSLADVDAGADDDIIALFSAFAGGSLAGGHGLDELVTLRSMDLSLLTLSDIEILSTDGNIITAAASQLTSFSVIREFHGEPDEGGGHHESAPRAAALAKSDRIDVFHHNPGGAGEVTLSIVASGAATVLDLSQQLGETAASITGSSDDEVITSGEGGDTLHGEDGNDVLSGGHGEDVLEGGAANDTLYGGHQADVLNGGEGIDFARYDGHGDIDGLTASLGSDPSLNAGAAAGDVYEQIEGIIAGAGNDTLSGNDVENYLYGLDGHDVLYGGYGADRLSGGTGIDVARYGDGDFGDMIISLATPSRNTGAAAGDQYIGIEGISGGEGSEKISGNGFQNYLYGYGGDDVIASNRGNDVLSGGSGADKFVFNAALDPHFNVDRILDFNSLDDTIVIDRSYFTGLEAGALDVSRFCIGPEAIEADHRIVYDSATGALLFDVNGNEAGGETIFARLAPGLALTAADISVIA